MAFDTGEVIHQLEGLVDLDREAIQAYDAAIARINNRAIRSALDRFKRDHIQHIDALTVELRNLGATPPERTRLPPLQGFLAVSAIRGDSAALNAIAANVRLNADEYEDALRQSWPERLIELVALNFADCRRHLAFILQAIEEELWEVQEPGAAS
ncbi:MAG: DUF2383 domain-containing protein [Myxococcaceae bacterium]